MPLNWRCLSYVYVDNLCLSVSIREAKCNTEKGKEACVYSGIYALIQYIFSPSCHPLSVIILLSRRHWFTTMGAVSSKSKHGGKASASVPPAYRSSSSPVTGRPRAESKQMIAARADSALDISKHIDRISFDGDNAQVCMYRFVSMSHIHSFTCVWMVVCRHIRVHVPKDSAK